MAAAAVLLTLLPLLVVRHPPLFDLPSHVARIAVLRDGGSSEHLRAMFSIEWAPIPNLALEMVMLPLSYVLELDTASRLFLVLLVLIQISGVALLSRAVHGHLSVLPFLAVFLVYNGILNFGFVGYLFGVGLFLLAFALWILLRDLAAPFRIALFAPLTSILFLCHLYGFGLFGLSAGAYELGRALGALRAGGSRRIIILALTRQLAILAAASLPAFVLLLGFSPTGGSLSNTTWADAWSLSAWAEKPEKVLYAMEAGLSGLDRVLLTALALTLVAGFVGRRLRFAPDLIAPVAALALVFFFMPTILASSWGADLRLPVPLGLIAVAGLGWRPDRSAVAKPMIVGALALVCLVRTASVLAYWVPADRILTAIRDSFARLPPGSSLMVQVPLEDKWRAWVVMPYYHFGGYAVADRHVFYPTVFVTPGAQPIRFTPDYEAKRHLSGSMEWLDTYIPQVERGSIPSAAALAAYDYVLVIEPERFGDKLSPLLEPIETGGNFALMRVKRDGRNRSD